MKNKYMENEYLSLVMFVIIFLVYAIVYMTKNCYSAAMVYLVEENILTKSQTGTINSAFYLAYAPFQILGGIAADKYSPYKLIAIGLFGAAVSNILILFVQNYYLILLIWGFNGAIQFGIWPGIFKIVSQCLAPSHRHNAIVYIAFASTIGLIISYIVAGIVSGWRSNFVVSSVSLLVTFVMWVVLGKFFDKRMVEGDDSHHGIAHLPEYKKNEAKPEGNFFGVIIKSGLAVIFPVCIIHTIFSLGTQSFIPTMIRESYSGISSGLASILAIIPVVAGLVGKLLIRIIYKNKIHNEAMMFVIIMAVMIPFIMLMYLIGKINVMLIMLIMSLIIMLASTAGMVSTPYVSTRFIKMGRNGTVSGLINAMSSFGIVAANIMTPYIAEKSGWSSVITSWIIIAFLSVVLAFAAYIPWKKFVKSIDS